VLKRVLSFNRHEKLELLKLFMSYDLSAFLFVIYPSQFVKSYIVILDNNMGVVCV